MAKAMMAGGVAASAILTSAYGVTIRAMATADGMREAADRRKEIIVQPCAIVGAGCFVARDSSGPCAHRIGQFEAVRAVRMRIRRITGIARGVPWYYIRDSEAVD